MIGCWCILPMPFEGCTAVLSYPPVCSGSTVGEDGTRERVAKKGCSCSCSLREGSQGRRAHAMREVYAREGRCSGRVATV